MRLDTSQFSQSGSSENGINLFLTGTQKFEKCFSIFFPDEEKTQERDLLNEIDQICLPQIV